MTRKEAIQVLKSMKSEESYNALIDLCNMAIEALQFAEHFDLLKEYQSLQEVVQCKDCKHGQYDATHYFCAEHHHKVYEDDFCSNGERIEESEVGE